MVSGSKCADSRAVRQSEGHELLSTGWPQEVSFPERQRLLRKACVFASKFLLFIQGTQVGVNHYYSARAEM